MMLSVGRVATVSRASKVAVRALQVRSLSSLQEKRHVHGTAREEQSQAISLALDVPSRTPKEETESTLSDRFVVTAEVAVSKIFPAGFGWQSASILAGKAGYASDSMNFAVTTGMGDAVGVLLGHMAYYSSKKAALGLDDEEIDITKELHTGILLGSAAFCSGTAWQPIVNVLQGADFSFTQVFTGTWLGCGAAFYAGLRVGRIFLSGPLAHIEEPTYENSKTDASLSAAIGGATGYFVGTDTAYLPDQNFLIDVVGIHDGTPDLTGCAIAGSSTALGFMTAQTGMNLAYPKGKSWND